MVDASEKEIDEKEFEDYLNDVYGDVNICGLKYPAGRALKQVDPIAFNVAHADHPSNYECGKCLIEHDDEDDAEQCCTEEAIE